jgi:hypothetical protein
MSTPGSGAREHRRAKSRYRLVAPYFAVQRWRQTGRRPDGPVTQEWIKPRFLLVSPEDG